MNPLNLLLQYRFSEDEPWKDAILQDIDCFLNATPWVDNLTLTEDIKVVKDPYNYIHIESTQQHDKIFIKVCRDDIMSVSFFRQSIKQVEITFPSILRRRISLIDLYLKDYIFNKDSYIHRFRSDNIKIKGNNKSERLKLNFYC